MNNPTLTEFCFGMIGRADIEGSKSDVAMNAWPPQASSLLPTGPSSIDRTAPRFSATQPVDAAPSRVGVARTLSKNRVLTNTLASVETPSPSARSL